MHDVHDPLGGLHGYDLRNLIFHLLQAGRRDEVDGLLRLEVKDKNAWHEARMRQGDVGGFAADIQLVVASVRPDGTEVGLVRSGRYALVAASIRGLADSMPSALRAALVREGIWTFARALADARQAATPEAIAALVPYADGGGRPGLLKELLALISAGDASAFVSSLATLERLNIARSVVMDELGDLLREAWVTLKHQEAERPKAIERMAAYLTDDLLAEAIAAATGAADPAPLMCLAAYHDDLGPAAEKRVTDVQRAELREATRDNPPLRPGERLAGMARTLRPGVVAEAVAIAECLDAGRRAEPLAALAGRLTGDKRDRVIADALADLDHMSMPGWRTTPLLTLAPLIPVPERGAILRRALDAALHRGGEPRAFALQKLTKLVAAPAASTELQQQVLDAVLTLTSMRADARSRLPGCLRSLAEVVVVDLLDAVVDAAREHGEDELPLILAIAGYRRGEHALTAEAVSTGRDLWDPKTAQRAAEVLPPGALSDAADLLTRIDDAKAQARTLAALARTMDGDARDAAAMTVVEITRNMHQYDLVHPWLIAALAPAMPDLPFDELVHLFDPASRYEWAAAVVAEGVAPYLPHHRHAEALRRVSTVNEHAYRARALVALARCGPAALRPRIQRDAVAACTQITSGLEAAEVVIGLGSDITPDLARRVATMARRSPNEYAAAFAVAACTQRLPVPERRRLVLERFEALRASEPDTRVHALQRVVPYALPEERDLLLAEALDAVEHYRSPGYRRARPEPWELSLELAGFAPILPEELVRRVFGDLPRALTHTDHAVRSLCALAAHLPADLVPGALAFIDQRLVGIGGEFDARAMEALAPRLAGALAHEATQVAFRIEMPRSRGRALAAIATQLSDDDAAPLLREAVQSLGGSAEHLLPVARQFASLPAPARMGIQQAALDADLEDLAFSSSYARRKLLSRGILLGTIEGLASSFSPSVAAGLVVAVRDSTKWWP
ncbi:hypothetical protein [Geodermatophilus poikilotrophus]|uniref:Uncharacterized protein n=1 Tax=Geodermatophilus poikilotrophus TaxID=1333667 RepID=A0A1I0E4K2_9ACTN|nr:hypothetical protein [Geodermatophilus poikilotrophus]SET39157.1 hypothetical protein SAMN04488546_2304 [Geodermatophilus poikilotrophus]